jgi:hypothetical protein
MDEIALVCLTKNHLVVEGLITRSQKHKIEKYCGFNIFLEGMSSTFSITEVDDGDEIQYIIGNSGIRVIFKAMSTRKYWGRAIQLAQIKNSLE